VAARFRDADRPLVAVVLALAAFGLATLYSAGQTDVPSIVTTIWQRQLVWLGLGVVCVFAMARLSPRMLEWVTPYAYGVAIALLLLTLVIGTGAGTAAGTRSWLAIGGHRVGQPAELGKLAVILMLARWLAERREPPATLRELITPCVIAGVPFLLVLKQPDLGSAIVYVAILFSMLFWAGAKPSLLVLLASPAIGLVLAFSTVAWGTWIVLLFILLLLWRPYVWEGLAVMLANVVMGVIALPFWRSLAPYQQNRIRGPPAGTSFNRRSRSALADCSARATPKAPRNGSPSSQRSTPTSSSRSWAKSWGSSGSAWHSCSSPRSCSSCCASRGARPIASRASWSSASPGCCSRTSSRTSA
jgi:rod shape determining protein RodA